ncbi:hypothetical protein, partial [Nostoc sp. UIC 10630]|uniref:hypothetical protein n=1 Tax=Nostoc sp. UIC 10630 TaxID=2100146 RepID=UPI0013F936AD
HSPFVYTFIKKILNDKRHFAAYDQVETLRRQLLHDNTQLELEDFGAGSAINNSPRRPIARIARNAAKPRKLSQLLFRIVHYYQPATIMELGTSLGISSSYMALANPAARVITGEGSKAVAGQAQKNFHQLALQNIEQVTGNFDDTLPAILQKTTAIDFFFFFFSGSRVSLCSRFVGASDVYKRQLPTPSYEINRTITAANTFRMAAIES